MKDYLIVGFGLAGMSMAAILEVNNKTFDVIDLPVNEAHRVIGGMYNPVILKRFTPAWKAHEMWMQSQKWYRYFEKKFDKQFIYPFEIYRILQSIEEQNNWAVASDKKVMKEYMHLPIEANKHDGIVAPFGLGKLDGVGRVAGEEILEYYRYVLQHQSKYKNELFEYSELTIGQEKISYQGNDYSKIIFAEGNFISKNPFFNYLPMKVSKGEMLIVKIPNLNLKSAIKSKVFMVPIEEDLFIVGATYQWNDPTYEMTQNGKKEIEEKLQSFLKLPYEIVDYKSGIRPTVLDRRPLIGQHSHHKNMYVLNGLGTRGIIYAPALAENLFQHIESASPLIKEANINRFNHLFTTKNIKV
jgi:glycine/D-amino acid oxidase-like deaminating enzyme